MIRIVSESNFWPLKWDRIGICSSRDKGGSATELSVTDAWQSRCWGYIDNP